MKPMLVVMKGLPCTGKTFLARKLSVNKDYLLVELDDIRDPIANGSRNTLEDEVINEISYQIASNVIAKLLRRAQRVILDCPLSHQFHFDLVIEKAVNNRTSDVLIVECRPQEFKWKEWINMRQQRSSRTTETWEEIKKLKDQRYGDYDTGNIRKIIVDTTMPSLEEFDELLSPYFLSVGNNSKRLELYGEMLTAWEQSPYAPSEGRSGLLSFHKIGIGSNRDRTRRSITYDQDLPETDPPGLQKMNHHHVLNIVTKPSQETHNCNGCRESIPGDSAFYRCKHCKFQLHKSCAEAPANLERQLHEEIPFIDPEINDFKFPETYWCGSSECDGNKFSEDCLECLFQTQLRCRFLPPVVPNHPCHPKHPLLLHIFRNCDDKDFKCRACSEIGDSVFYKCYACKIYLHVNCALLPRMVKSECHLDTLSLIKSSPTDDPDAYDEIYCDACETERNPKNWIYYCEACDYATHLHCALSSPN